MDVIEVTASEVTTEGGIEMRLLLLLLYITSTAQWSTRRNQMIFAVLDVSLNNGP